MNKILKQLFADYLADKSDIRLEILCANINPEFKLNKKNKEQISLLVSDYEKDKSDARLNILVSFIGVAKSEKVKRGRPAKIVEVKKEDLTVMGEIDREFKQINEEMQDMQLQIREAKGDKMVLSSLAPAYRALEQRLMVCIQKKERENAKNLDPKKIERERILRLFGDPKDEKSLAHGILNGTKYEFQVKMAEDPAVMIKRLYAINGVEAYDYSALLMNPTERIWVVKKGFHDTINQGMGRIGGSNG
jgi:hypothetical protein